MYRVMRCPAVPYENYSPNVKTPTTHPLTLPHHRTVWVNKVPCFGSLPKGSCVQDPVHTNKHPPNHIMTSSCPPSRVYPDIATGTAARNRRAIAVQHSRIQPHCASLPGNHLVWFHWGGHAAGWLHMPPHRGQLASRPEHQPLLGHTLRSHISSNG
jgi:hypothetical protein